MRRTALSAAFLLALFGGGACRVESPYMDLNQAYGEIATAIGATEQRCGQQPAYPLLLPRDPSEYGVRLCSLLILQATCPFNDYPIGCFEIYTASCDTCDLPLFDPE